MEPPVPRYQFGRAIVITSGVVMSVSGPLIRLLEEASEWQFLAYRSLSIIATLLVVLAIQHRGQMPRMFAAAGLRALLAGFLMAASMIGVVFSFLNTTIANTLFLMCTAPFLTAILGWIFLGERPGRRTWLAIAIAMTGAATMLVEGVATGDMFGDLTALGAAASFAAFSVTIRGGRNRDMGPAVLYAGIISGAFSALAAMFFGSGLSAVSGWDIGISLTYGVVAMGAGLLLYTLGSRHVPAAELNVLSLGEMVLAPAWVWFGFGEVPSAATLFGGAVLVIGIAVQATAGSDPASVVTQRPPAPNMTHRVAFAPIASIASGLVLLTGAVTLWIFG